MDDNPQEAPSPELIQLLRDELARAKATLGAAESGSLTAWQQNMARQIMIKRGAFRDGHETYEGRIEASERDYGADVEMCYPARDKPPLRVTIGIMDVRAANSIAIEYDFKRDGYVIRMDRTKCYGTGCDVVEENVEVAFIPAWLEDGE
jgi:hypothetical protein